MPSHFRGPPWHGEHMPSRLSRKRRFLFWRVARFAIPLLLLIVAASVVAAWWALRQPGLVQNIAGALWLAGCGFGLMIFMVMAGFGARAFREFSTPLSTIMAAADAVADGDLSVRVPERGPGEFGRLSRSFNRMVSQLAEAEESRRNLTADVAHELRTPLHIIQGNLEGILDGVYASDPDQINTILDETRLLTRLVEDLQTLSLAEAGELAMKPGQVQVVELVEDVKASFSSRAASVDVRLVTAHPAEAGKLIVNGDRERLDQGLSNLVANAFQHTPPGGTITLTTSLQGGSVIIQVADTGGGISPDDMPHIFDRFWRADRSRSRQSGGSGLGLSITRQLIEAHGGRIDVKSTQGEGTTFTVELPSTSGLG